MFKPFARTHKKREMIEEIDKHLEFLIKYVNDERKRELFTPEVISRVVATELEYVRKTLKEYEAL